MDLTKSKGKMENFTISSGFTAPHGHSGQLGQCPAGWPNTAAFGMAHAPVHARGVVRCTPTCQWLNNDEVFSLAILLGPSTSGNTKN
jgi:hypothetical protein